MLALRVSAQTWNAYMAKSNINRGESFPPLTRMALHLIWKPVRVQSLFTRKVENSRHNNSSKIIVRSNISLIPLTSHYWHLLIDFFVQFEVFMFLGMMNDLFLESWTFGYWTFVLWESGPSRVVTPHRASSDTMGWGLCLPLVAVKVLTHNDTISSVGGEEARWCLTTCE